MFCRQHGFKLRVVDVGVDYDLSKVDGIIDRKIARGTKNFLYEPAMSEEEFDHAIQIGSDLVDDCTAEGCRILCIGEMGIGNTSPSSIWMSIFGDIPLKDCIGAGAGLNNAGIRHKSEVLSKAVSQWGQDTLGHGHVTKYPDPIVTQKKLPVIGKLFPSPWVHNRFNNSMSTFQISSIVESSTRSLVE